MNPGRIRNTVGTIVVALATLVLPITSEARGGRGGGGFRGGGISRGGFHGGGLHGGSFNRATVRTFAGSGLGASSFRSRGFNSGALGTSGRYFAANAIGRVGRVDPGYGVNRFGRYGRYGHYGRYGRYRGLLYPLALGAYSYGYPYDDGTYYGYTEPAPESSVADAPLTAEELQLVAQWRDYRRRNPDRYAALAAADPRIPALMYRADQQLGPE